ncbi:MAG: bifunctional (p)ppGpp synthetase/guanosine-3',5'-bis(diphosphate) 3'-pyrophosphohydrolase [Blastocatellia bacterium]|nr:bifunctional (p)ppGpp synthetase/guanosine-3',5'-bis(diphosphate) 3'-pyrophosphohydrolase [Blastocatellia bacterium]
MIEEVASKLNFKIEQHKREESEVLQRALELAEKAHQGQFRKTKTNNPYHHDPYIIHPMRVALVLIDELGISDTNMIAAAILHDVVEDSEVTIETIRDSFDEDVAEIVLTLTKPPHSPSVSRHQQLSAYHEKIFISPERIKLIKLADRLDNIREAISTTDIAFQKKYLKETREIYLPLAALTNSFFHTEISAYCDRLEEALREYAN